MMSNNSAAPAMCALLAALMSAAPALAQTGTPRAERPYRGLFASGVDDAGQSLIATGSIGGGYDSNVFADLGATGPGIVTDPRFARPGMVGSASGALEYALRQDKVDFMASFGDAYRYYPQNSQTSVNSYTQSAGVSYRASRRTTIGASQYVAYQPFMLSLFPSLFDPTFPSNFDPTPGQLTLPTVDLAPG